jgi:hypothetical protein
MCKFEPLKNLIQIVFSEVKGERGESFGEIYTALPTYTASDRGIQP